LPIHTSPQSQAKLWLTWLRCSFAKKREALMPINLTTQSSVFDDTNGNGFAEIGEQITYTFEIKNDETGDLTGITFTNPNILISGFNGNLAVGETKTVTGVYTLQAADLDNGQVSITQTATTGTLTSNSTSDTENLTVRASLTVSKEADRIEDTNVSGLRGDAGDTIVYEINVKNNSPRTAFNVALQDFPGSAVTGIPVSLTGLTDEDADSVADDLGINGIATGFFDYIIQQSDLDNEALGFPITNRAAARGVTKSGGSITGTVTTTVDIGPQPKFTIVKIAGDIKDAPDSGEFIDANGDGIFGNLGDGIKYTYKFTNTGTITLKDIQGFDDQGTPGDGVDQTLVFTPGVLSPGEVATATYEAPVTQELLDTGSLTNTVRANAKTIADSPLDFKTDVETVTVNFTPLIDITKAASPTVIDNAKAGDTVDYTYTLKNIGPVSLLNVSLVDDNGTPGVLGDDFTINALGTFRGVTQIPGAPPLTGGLTDIDGDGAVDDLAVGATTNATYTGTLTQQAIDAGVVTNIVVGTGTDRKGTTVRDEATATVTLNETPLIEVTKAARPTVIDNAKVGDAIEYTYTLKNPGPVSLLNVNLVDNNGTPSVLGDDFTINALGTFRGGIQILGAPPLTGGLTDIDGDGAVDDLAVGATTNATYTGTLTQQAIDAGVVTNIVVGTGTDRKGTTVRDEATATVTLNETPLIEVTKAARPTVIDNAKVGDAIEYTYTLKNPGPVSLLNVNLVDNNGTPSVLGDDFTINALGTFRGGIQILGAPPLTGGLTDIDGDGAVDDLAVGATTNATYTGTLTQQAIDAGVVTNIVVGTGTDRKGTTVRDEATATVTVNLPTGTKTGIKFEDLNHNGCRDLGEPGLSGWTIYADKNGNSRLDAGEISDVTDATGRYVLELPPGTYTIREVLQEGWVQSRPSANGGYDVTIKSGDAFGDCDFGNYRICPPPPQCEPPKSDCWQPPNCQPSNSGWWKPKWECWDKSYNPCYPANSNPCALPQYNQTNCR
jgi:uncharacterized repeat protein (TIGR01451 family)